VAQPVDVGRRGLTPERWQRLESLFAEAVDLPGPGQQAVVERATAEDPELGDELGRLLAEAPRAGDRIARAIGAAAEVPLAAGHWEGRRLGPYRIVREVGRGGMGLVFEAVREGEYQQTVALKLAPWSRDLAVVDARFRQERQILAGLVHPHIARLLDGGTEDGIPYLVMEYVEGQPITEYCRERGLGLRARIALFLQVLAAVRFAHEHLVVHRDLKPANILVGADGVAKLLDFGIAKLMDAAGDSAATATGLAMWTPDYTSPEQVQGRPVTTRTDVYSLGLVLHELVTGERAQVADTSSPRALDRSICEVEPPAPSARAAARGEHALARRLRGDVDTIVATAIRKDPERRYASATALAEDLGRHLEGRPILARPGTVRYRAGRFLRRHRLAVTAGALIAASVAGGVAMTLHQARRAERRFQQLRTLANTFVFDVHDRIEPLPGSTAARKAIVETALTYLENLRADAGGDSALGRELAAAYQKVGNVQGNPLQSNLGDTAGALASFDRAVEILAPLAEAGDRDARRQLASVLANRAGVSRARGDKQWLAGLDRARALAEAAVADAPADVAALVLLGDVHATLSRGAFELGDHDRAARSGERAMEIARRLVELEPAQRSHRLALSTAHGALASTRLSAGRIEDAAASFRESAALREQLVREDPGHADYRRNLLVSYGNLGDVLGYRVDGHLGDVAGAAAAYRRSIELATEARRLDPDDRRATFDLSSGELRLGTVLLDDPARRAEALAHLEQAERLNLSLLAQEPGSDRYGYVAVAIERRIGEALFALGRRREAMRRLESAHARAAGFVDGPQGPSARVQRVLSAVALAELRALAGDPRAAATAEEAALDLAGQPAGPVKARACAALARAHLELARRARGPERAAHLRAAALQLEAARGEWRAARVPPAFRSRGEGELAAIGSGLARLGYDTRP
jgi:eukaryotic-like serine/threonine-protein kinase